MVNSRPPAGSLSGGSSRASHKGAISNHQTSIMFYSSSMAAIYGITSTRRYCPPITKITGKRMITAPLIPPDRYIESGALVCGSSALLLSRILRSANVATVVSNPPGWVDRADLHAQVAAIHRAAEAFETASSAHERESATPLGAVTAELDTGWPVRRAATYLGLSPRRVQELAPELGGRRAGRRQWVLDPVAVRHEKKRRAEAA